MGLAAFILAVVKAIPAATNFVHWISDTIREQQAQARLAEKDAAVDRVLAPFMHPDLMRDAGNQDGQLNPTGSPTRLPDSSTSGPAVGK